MTLARLGITYRSKKKFRDRGHKKLELVSLVDATQFKAMQVSLSSKPFICIAVLMTTNTERAWNLLYPLA
jgi:hypothetical protein